MKPKEYLRPCDIVKTRSGELYMYIPDYFGIESFVGNRGYLCLDSYNDNLEISPNNPSFCIDCIYRTEAKGLGFLLLNKISEYHKLIWERNSTIELTMEDIAKKYGVNKVIITNYKE